MAKRQIFRNLEAYKIIKGTPFYKELENDNKLLDKSVLIKWIDEEGSLMFGGAFYQLDNKVLQCVELFGKYPNKRFTLLKCLAELKTITNNNQIMFEIPDKRMQKYAFKMNCKHHFDNYYLI